MGSGTLGASVGFPVYAIDPEFGQELVTLSGSLAKLRMYSLTRTRNITSFNILAETNTGNSESIVCVGGHLDSVDAGPGINDDGSGSATVLQIALEMHKAEKKQPLVNKVRFAWWGAEERGLVGSTAYVNDIGGKNTKKNISHVDAIKIAHSESSLGKIAMYLNFDMIGSPNFFYGIFNGSSGASNYAKKGSTIIQNIFEEYFKKKNIPYEFAFMSGRTDYGEFIKWGIPSGGMFTGAEVEKTVDQRRKYGGLARTAFDPCYHKACDTVENVNFEALEITANAAAFVTDKVARQKNLRTFLGTSNNSTV